MKFNKGDKIKLTRDYPLDPDSSYPYKDTPYPKGTVLTFKDYGPYLTTQEDGRFFYSDDFELVEE